MYGDFSKPEFLGDDTIQIVGVFVNYLLSLMLLMHIFWCIQVDGFLLAKVIE